MGEFLRNCWYAAAWENELADGVLLPRSIIGERVVLFRQRNGTLVALEDACPHRFAPLSRGRLEDGCNIRCMYHGLKFAPSGECIEIPGQAEIPSAAKVKTYPLALGDDLIWIWMGDPDFAPNTLVPRAAGYNEPGAIMRVGQVTYNANYELVNDNLTDFSHIGFVHGSPEGFAASESVSTNRPKVEFIDRGIRVTRWRTGQERGAGRNDFPIAGYNDPTSVQWAEYTYCAPGVLRLEGQAYAPSVLENNPAYDRDPYAPPPKDAVPRGATISAHIVTPMTNDTTRHFYSWGMRKQDGDEDGANRLLAMARVAFAEDKAMIEAQFDNMQGKDRNPFVTTFDVGPLKMRSVMRELLQMEMSD
jgi:phenylpropionate dioxygenase-like ring-hydroxylating dioxygenase large terminal subunit